MKKSLISICLVSILAGGIVCFAGNAAAKSSLTYAEFVKGHDWARTETWCPYPIEMVDTSKYKKKPPYIIAYANCGVNNSWGVQSVMEFKYAAEKHGDLIKEIVITDAQEKADKQISDLQDLVTKGVDAITVRPKSEAALDPIITRLHKQGIPIICASRRIKSDNFATFVTASTHAEGRLHAIWMAQMLKGKGNIVLLGGLPGASSGEERTRAQRDTLKKYPGIKILEFQYGYFSPAKSKEVMAAMIQSYGDKIDGILCECGFSSMGAIEAMVEAGMKPVPITGDFFNGFLKRAAKYNFPAMAYSYPVSIHGAQVDAAIKVLQGVSVPKLWMMKECITTTVVDTEDVKADIPWSAAARMDMGDDLWCDTSLPEDMIREKFGLK